MTKPSTITSTSINSYDKSKFLFTENLRNFYQCDKPSEVFNKLFRTFSSKRSFYDLMIDDKPIQPVFDIDISKKPEHKIKSLVDKVEQATITAIKVVFDKLNLKLTDNQIKVYVSHGYDIDNNYKGSFHFLLRGYSITLVEMKKLYRHVVKEISNINPEFTDFFDDIYNNNRQLRTLYSTKGGEDRFKTLKNGGPINEKDFIESLPTVVPDGAIPITDVPEIQGLSKPSNPVYEVKVEKCQNDDLNQYCYNDLDLEHQNILDSLLIETLPNHQINGKWYDFTLLSHDSKAECPIHKRIHDVCKNYLIITEELTVLVGCQRSSARNKDEKPIYLGSLQKDPETWGEFAIRYDQFVFRVDHKPHVERTYFRQMRKVIGYIYGPNLFVGRNHNGWFFPSLSPFQKVHYQYWVEKKDKDGNFVKDENGKTVKELAQKSVPFAIHVTKNAAYSELVFNPKLDHKDHQFNLFKGYKAELINYESDEHKAECEAEIQPLIDHIKEIWCDRDEAVFKWIMKYFYSILFEPWIKTEKLLCLLSKNQGNGKTIVLEFMVRELFGYESSIVVNGIDPLIQRFNTAIANKTFIICNELDSQDGKRTKFNKLKTLVTDAFQAVEPKGRDIFQVQSFLNLVIVGNYEDSVYSEDTDRRLFIPTMSSDMPSPERVEDLVRICKKSKTSGNTFYTWIYHFAKDIAIDIQNAKHRPKSALQERVKGLSRTNISGFIDLFTKEEHLAEAVPLLIQPCLNRKIKFENDVMFCTKQVLFEVFKEYCNDREIRFVPQRKQFDFDLDKLLISANYRKNGYNIRGSKLSVHPDLEKLIDEELIDEK